MLTLKWITPSGEEFVYETTHINFVPATANNEESAEDSLWYYETDGTAIKIDTGSVYVMNEAGATVAKYSLQYPPKQT